MIETNCFFIHVFLCQTTVVRSSSRLSLTNKMHWIHQFLKESQGTHTVGYLHFPTT